MSTPSDEQPVDPTISDSAPTLPMPGRPVARVTPDMPKQIGRYRILGVLGAGGMGMVYQAQQENPSRTVALKVIRAGYLSDEMLRRFTQEAQVLGRLQHPGIAQVYEAGTVSDERGRPMPFFAMEFIKGAALTDYVEARKLGTRQRLDLIAKVCDAVYHAHQKGVIHRDLKPGNIIVDERGQPKILDFGIARATDSDMQSVTLQTDIGQLIGTVPYMSPEQVSGDPNDLDTRSDVYALGVIAYELLAGRMPYDLQKKVIHEAARIIKEEEPTRLSVVNRTLRGDVETIVAKALEKDKARRYQSAESLASDIRRYLNDEPIAARPASAWYQFAKFSRRNRGLVAGIAAAFVLLLAGVIGTSLALGRALKAERGLTAQLAETEVARADEARIRAKAEAMIAFVTNALQSGNPFGQGTRDMTIVEAMSNAAKELDTGLLKDQPESEAGIRATIGQILMNNGRPEEAQPLFEQALATVERAQPVDNVLLSSCLNNLGVIMRERGQFAQAEPLLTRSLAISEQFPGPERTGLASSLLNLAGIYSVQSQFAKAEPLFARALEIYEAAFGPDHLEVAGTLNNFADMYRSQGEFSKAESRYLRALAIREKLLGPAHPEVAQSLNNLAEVYRAQRQFTAAEPLFERALAIREKALGPDHPSTANSLNNLASLYQSQRKFAQAEPLFQRALAISERAVGPDHPSVAVILNNVAAIYRTQNDFAKAEPLLVRAVAIWERVLGPDHPTLAAGLNNLARTRQALGQTAEARQGFDRAIAMMRKVSPEGSALFARVLWASGSARLDLKDAAGALLELQEAVLMGEQVLKPEDPQLTEYRDALAKCKGMLETPAVKPGP